MAKSEDVEERKRAAEELKNNFAVLKDKIQAWEDLHKLTSDTKSDVRSGAVFTLVSAFSDVPDKKQAWNDLHRLTFDTENDVRKCAAYALGSAFSQVHDKKYVWEDMHRLTSDTDNIVRRVATYTLESAFSHVPDKKQAWEDLIRLTSDTDSDVRWRALNALGSVFSQVPDTDKKQAWGDLHRLTSDTDSGVRWVAAWALRSVFSNIPDKKQAWNDLIRLVQDGEINVGWEASDPLGSVFSFVHDKKQAQDDLHQLIQDDENFGCGAVALALGGAYPYVPNKDQAWNDLQRLTKTEWTFANYSLGKASIFKATEVKNNKDFKRELETAMEFFEKSNQEVFIFEPAKFCLPFYRSFHAIIFEKENGESEVEKYIAETKSAVEGSESKEKLLEAVENLMNALKEARKARNLNERTNALNAIRRYCDRACELLDTTEDKAPGASRLIRKGLPIIGRTIKELISELKTKSRDVCIQTKDKPQNKIAAEIYSEIKKLDVENPVKFDYDIDILTESLKMKIPNVKGNEHILEKIEALRFISESDYKSLISKLIPIIGAIPQVVIERDQINIENFKGNFYTGSINSQNINKKKEQNMSININSSGTQSRVNIGSVDRSTNLITGDLKTDLENLKNLIENDYHKEDKPEIIQAIDRIKKNCNDSSKKNALKEKLGWILTRTSEVSSISSFVIALLQTYTGT